MLAAVPVVSSEKKQSMHTTVTTYSAAEDSTSIIVVLRVCKLASTLDVAHKDSNQASIIRVADNVQCWSRATF
jgi:hypothetical protein